MKAGGSKVIYPKWWDRFKPKVDLIALAEYHWKSGYPAATLQTWLVQVKKRGKITKAEKADLKKFSVKYSCTCLLASKLKGEIVYE